MPYADSAATARRWATDRAIDLWAVFAGDLDPVTVETMAGALADARRDGARVAVIAARPATSRERRLADHVVDGPAAPTPFGLFRALEATGIGDARRLGVLGGSVAALEAGHRAGAGAIVGLAPADPGARRPLLAGQPDLIVEAAGFAAVDAERYASGRARRERVLLNPGPAVVSDRVHRAISGPDLCHREPEYEALFSAVRSKLLHVAGVGDDWAVALIAGSGTAAMEAMTGALVRPERKLLVCQNGVYGERIATIADRLGVEVVPLIGPHTEPIHAEMVAALLEGGGAIDAVAVVHHETTTGLLNPVHEIAAIANARGVPVITDAISSFGAEELQIAGSGLDIVAGTSNKCLHGLPGVAFLLLSPRAQARLADVPPRSLYFDVANYLRAQSKRTVPFTPATPAIYALNAALDELLDEGVEYRRDQYRARMAYLDREFARLGLEPIVAPAHRSSSVRSLPLPTGITYDELHDVVKRDGYVIYAGLGTAATTSFRVCALGALEIGVLEGFIASLERALEGVRTPATAV
jgi:2-aminoethylphosphonate-pyruvate transaminase